MKSRAHLCVVACIILLLELSGASAQSVTRQNSANRLIGEYVSVELYGGYLSGESTELVLDSGTGHVDSRLTWKINKAAVIGGSIAISPQPWMTFKASGWVPVSSVNTMDDFDYLVAGADWSDHSHHDDTRLNHASSIDLRLGLRFVTLPATKYFDNASMRMIAGFRWYNVSWTAAGGSYIYSSGGGFRNDVGSFAAGTTVINYEQWMKTPFLGLGGTMDFGRWSIDGSVIGSLWGQGSDRDDHVLRTTVFTDEFSKVKMVGVDVALNYAMSERLTLFGRYEYQEYFEAQGPSTATNYSTGTVTHTVGNAAGMANYSMVLSLGVKGKL